MATAAAQPSVGDYYQILGIRVNASADEIRQGYRRSAFQHHPDRNPDAGCEELMKKINKAYEVLSDSVKRTDYDRERHEKAQQPMWTGELLTPLPNAVPCSAELQNQFLTLQLQPVAIELGQFPAATAENLRQFVSDPLKKLTSHYSQCPTSHAKHTPIKPERYDTLVEAIAQLVNDPTLCKTATDEHKHLVRLVNYARMTECTSVQPVISEGAQVPIIDFSCLSTKNLHFLCGLFTSGSGSDGSFQTIPASKLLKILLKFVPHVEVQQAPGIKEPNHCGSCEQKFGLLQRNKVYCLPCGKFQCSLCPLHVTTLPRLGRMMPQKVCHTCATKLSREYGELWMKVASQLLSEGTMEKAMAAFGCFMVALACCENFISKYSIRLARELIHHKMPELALPLISTLLQHSTSVSTDTLKLHLLGASALKTMADLEDEHFWEDKWVLLLGAKQACLEASYAQSCLGTSTDVPQLHVKTEEVNTAMHMLTKQRDLHAKNLVEETNTLLEKAWEGRDWTKLLETVTTERDHNLIAATNNRDTTMEALQRLVETKEGFLSRMLPEDHFALIFFRGLLHFHSQRYMEGLADFQAVAWSGQHLDWAIKAIVDILLSLEINNSVRVLPHHKLNAACEALAKSPSSGFNTTTIELLSPFLSLSPVVLRPPSMRHWPCLRVPCINQVAHSKYEEAVEQMVQKGKWNNTQAAFAYVDLIPACEHPAEVVVCFLTASLWFLEEIRKVTKTQTVTSNVNAVKTVTLTLVQRALSVAQLSLHPGMRMYVSRIAFGVALEVTHCAGELSTTEDSKLVIALLTTLAHNCRFCPFWNPPMVRVSEAVLLNIISGRLHSEFILGLQHVRPELSPVTVPELRYQLYENDLRFVRPLQDPDNAYKKAMQEMLKKKGWTFADVSNLMTSPLSPRTSDGWLKQQPTLGVPMEYAEIKGFLVDLDADSPSVQLLVEPADSSSGKVGLVSRTDVDTVLHLKPEDVFPLFFSLEQPSSTEHFHPFQEFRYQPDSLQGTPLLHTLFETDYLLKSFSIGVDVSAKPPFEQRPCQDGLTRNLPPELQAILKPVKDRGYSCNRMHRFWIQADKLTYDVTESDSKVTYLLGPVKMAVRSHPLLLGPDGKLLDTSEDDDPNSPEAKFAEDLTKNYDLISEHFLMFARLQELCKLQFLGLVLAHLLKILEERAQGNGISVSEDELREIQQEELQKIKANLRKALHDVKQQIGSWPSANDPLKVSMARQEEERCMPRHMRNQFHDFRSLEEYLHSRVEERLQRRDASTLSQVVDDLIKLFQPRYTFFHDVFARSTRSTLESYVRRWLSKESDSCRLKPLKCTKPWRIFDSIPVSSGASSDCTNSEDELVDPEDELVDFVASEIPLTTRDDIRQAKINFFKQRYTAFSRKLDCLQSAAAHNIRATAKASRMSSCRWVPAALRKEVYNGGTSMSLCYGGVLLAPEIEEASIPTTNASKTLSVELQAERPLKQGPSAQLEYPCAQILMGDSIPKEDLLSHQWINALQKSPGISISVLAEIVQVFTDAIERNSSQDLPSRPPVPPTALAAVHASWLIFRNTPTDAFRDRKKQRDYRKYHCMVGRAEEASHTISLQTIKHIAITFGGEEIDDVEGLRAWANTFQNFERVPRNVNRSVHTRIDNKLERKCETGELLTPEEELRARMQARVFIRTKRDCPQSFRPHMQRFFESLRTRDGASVWVKEQPGGQSTKTFSSTKHTKSASRGKTASDKQRHTRQTSSSAKSASRAGASATVNEQRRTPSSNASKVASATVKKQHGTKPKQPAASTATNANKSASPPVQHSKMTGQATSSPLTQNQHEHCKGSKGRT